MCGIAGFWQDPAGARDELLARARAMAAELSRRGPDDEGAWADAEAGVALGFRRLAVIDPSPDGHQPMVSSCGRYVLVYNGEVYNFPALRRELIALGRTFRGHSDTEVILEAMAEWGLASALPRFNGMFALALWDRRERCLHLVRDRLGIKPLYWGVAGDVVLFGSELRGLRPHPAFRGEIDRGALALYLRHNYIPDPHCIYRGFQRLAPGHRAVFRQPGPPEIRAWWSARDVARAGQSDPLRAGDAEVTGELDRVLRAAVAARMVADVPLGAFLSGGIDSSLVVALMQAESSRPVRTFTIGQADADRDEAPHARRIAGHLGTDHTELAVGAGDALDLMDALPDLWDEPFGDSSQIPTFIVSRLARGHVTVALSGDGGDELFGGYRHHRDRLRQDRNAHRIPPFLRGPVRRLLRHLPSGRPGSTAGLARKLRRLSQRLDGDPDQALYQEVVSQCTDPDGLLGAGHEPATALRDPTLIADLPGLHERMMYLDSVTYLPGDILTKVDRASMAVSLEARVPLLDHRVYELAWRLPLAQRVGPGDGKRALRQVLARYVPPALFERPKRGFSVPVAVWLRGPLRDRTGDLLAPARLRHQQIFRSEAVETVLGAFLAGDDRQAGLVWSLLVFQLWLDRWHGAGARAGRPAAAPPGISGPELRSP